MSFDPVSFAMGQQAGGGGGGGVTVEPLSVTANGTYTAPTGKAYSPVTVNVANSYTTGDEGKVVSNGELVAQTAHVEVTQNGTIDTTLNNSVTVNVQGSGVQVEESVEVQLEVGADVSALYTFASNHTVADGWTIYVVSAKYNYPLIRFYVKASSKSPSSIFLVTKNYHAISSGTAVCTLDPGTYIVTDTSSPYNTDSIKLRAIKFVS